jgi:superfamily II DNA or RNA helicase
MEAARIPDPPPRRPPWPAQRPLRAWQEAALERVLASGSGDFLASATPAAGKTTLGLRVAHELLRAGAVRRVCVVAPTTHICRQWARAAAGVGIDLEPGRANVEGPEPRDRDGVAVTYQTVAAAPALHRRACRSATTLLIADEPHHLGELAAWGEGAASAFEGAKLRLLLSGTPFRSDNAAIPWVRYDEEGISAADHAYTYTDALVDGVCRPITFLAYGGEMEWTSAGRTRSAAFDTVLPRAEAARRLRTALDPRGDWIGEVLRDADARLGECRTEGHRDAGGLVVAADKAHAAAIAQRLHSIAGEPPAIVTSDDPGASAAIDRFARGDARWLVSVLMVSEGVDVPRLRVGVYATPARTELFFRQVVGRFVRRTPSPRSQMSYLLVPADPRLKELAARVEEERRHALDRRPELEQRDAPPERTKAGEGFVALSSSATLDDVIRSSTQAGDALLLFAEEGTPEVATPAPPRGEEPAQEKPADAATPTGAPEESGPEPAYRRRERLRERRAGLVSDLARSRGHGHREVNAWVNRSVGVASVGEATVATLEQAVQLLERELQRRR